jgi:hypothetical protein
MGGGVGGGRTNMDKTLDITELMTFDTSFWKDSPCEGKRLGWHWIFKSLYITCWKRFQRSMETVDWSKKQTAQSLFNHHNWKNMKFGTRIAIGRVLRFFVRNKWLGLKVTNPKATGTKFYARIDL